ncbi:MAG: 16S rRNA (uracil(1498)-N(3))-methyltransferase [Microscillaceae bacterium]|nr:16S rRNA (uracil(1498)-N(3))-methyltransferase [Microscillaceae bacterium]MDW8460302.1 16S rRNA (uracil(1498)-N(3))-methyltransferase [Cytophagales bacterium]
MHLFFQADFTEKSTLLCEEETHHAVKVLRLKQGAILQLTNGKGELFDLQLVDIQGKQAQVKLLQKVTAEPANFCIHLAIAPTKNMERVEWLVEKLVEIGIQKISFVQCERSERKNLNLERLQKIAISALKQSLQTFLPTLYPLISFKEWIKKDFSANTQKFIAYLSETPAELLQKKLQPNQNYVLLVGPEGDFSPQEVALAQRQGFEVVSLGKNRLRTETAGLVACLTCQIVTS